MPDDVARMNGRRFVQSHDRFRFEGRTATTVTASPKNLGDEYFRHAANWASQKQNGPQFHRRTVAKRKSGKVDFVRIHKL